MTAVAVCSLAAWRLWVTEAPTSVTVAQISVTEAPTSATVAQLLVMEASVLAPVWKGKLCASCGCRRSCLLLPSEPPAWLVCPPFCVSQSWAASVNTQGFVGKFLCTCKGSGVGSEGSRLEA